MYQSFPTILKVVTIVQPETLVRWHRAGFRRHWRWKSRSRGGRPQVELELRTLIRQMSMENQLWGAPRVHGELLKLGFSVAQSSVAKYMVKRCGPPSQGWRTFLRSHAPDIAAMDLFVVPTIGFKLLHGFVIVRIHRRDLVWINVTANPTAEWVARQITEACCSACSCRLEVLNLTAGIRNRMLGIFAALFYAACYERRTKCKPAARSHEKHPA